MFFMIIILVKLLGPNKSLKMEIVEVGACSYYFLWGPLSCTCKRLYRKLHMKWYFGFMVKVVLIKKEEKEKEKKEWNLKGGLFY